MTTSLSRRRARLTTAQNRQLVVDYLHTGMTLKELAQKWGYTYQGMRQKLLSTGLQSLIAEEQDYIRQESGRARAILLANAPNYAREADSIAQDREHRDQPQMLRYLLDQTLGKRPEEQQNDHAAVQVQAEVIKDTMGVLKEILEYKKERAQLPHVLDGGHILEGEAALPKAAGYIEAEVVDE